MTAWFCQRDNRTGEVKRRNLDDEPSHTICAQGMGDSFASEYWIEIDEGGGKLKEDKPPYSVPLIAEIAAMPWNGFTVASTFAGAGGSSTGYRMAGFKVIYANEFVPIAQESYRANCAPHTVVDGRDVKVVKGGDILAAGDLKAGDLDLFDGSPPCQAFSTAGRREKGWGTDKVYEHGASQKNEELFFDYIRLRDEMMPRVFVAENVSGLVKGTAKGFFIEIMTQLRKGYRVEARMLDAQWLGVPQARQRIIMVGVRDDIGIDPVFPRPLPYRYSVRDALPWLTRASMDERYRESVDVIDRPAFTIRATAGMPNHEIDPETDISRFAIGAEYDRLNPGQQSERFFSLVRADAEEPSPAITASGGGSSTAGVVHPTEKRKFSILEVKRLCSFPDDFKLCGSYGQMWERLGNSVPPLMAKAVGEAIRDHVLIPWRDRKPHAKKPGWKSESSSGSGAGSKSAALTNAGRGRAPNSRPATVRSGRAAGNDSTRTGSRSRSPTGRSTRTS